MKRTLPKTVFHLAESAHDFDGVGFPRRFLNLRVLPQSEHIWEYGLGGGGEEHPVS